MHLILDRITLMKLKIPHSVFHFCIYLQKYVENAINAEFYDIIH